VAFTGVCLLGAAILVKAAMVQIKEGPELRAEAKQMLTKTTTLPAERGNIYTENGQLLCSTIPQFDVHVDFSVINRDTFNRYIDTLSGCMANLFRDATPAQYKQFLKTGYKAGGKYFSLKRNLPYYQYQALRSFPIFKKGKARGGLICESKTKRINPYGLLAYRTIGLYRENAQTIGLEKTFDSVLHGENGTRVDQKATGGVWMPVEGSEIEPQNGRDLVTTLDIGVQEVAEHAMKTILAQYECQYGTCIVMEVSTGKIRALVNLGRQQDGSYWEDFNYAMIPTEPGSTFKLVTLISLLNDGYINVEKTVDAEGGAIRFGKRTMRDSHLGLGVMTIKDAFAHSSNAAMAKLAYQYYAQNPSKYVKHLHDLHLDKKTGIDLAGERKPLVKTPANTSWSATTLPWMATGYEVLVSPLHTCMVYNAVANGGKMMKPYLISAQQEYGKNTRTFEPVVLEEAIADPAAIAQLQACTREVVLTGTGKSIASPYYAISGKTGTAQVADKGIKYTDGVYQGSFVGYFPSEKPKYTIAVVVRTKPHSSAYYGGTIAAPVFRMIADKIFSTSVGAWQGPIDSIIRKGRPGYYSKLATTSNSFDVMMSALGLKPAGQFAASEVVQLTQDSSRNISLRSRGIVHGTMPDVKGLGLKDAVYMLENQGLKVNVQGRGLIQGQSIAPGTKIIKGQTIILQLS
jgi:cell division protein FtsI (penicillin-binding protein 3)